MLLENVSLRLNLQLQIESLSGICFLNFVIRTCEYHKVVKNSSVTAVTSVSVYLLVFHFSLQALHFRILN